MIYTKNRYTADDDNNKNQWWLEYRSSKWLKFFSPSLLIELFGGVHK